MLVVGMLVVGSWFLVVGCCCCRYSVISVISVTSVISVISVV